MKKIFFLLSLASFVLVSCEKFKDNPPYGFGNEGSIPVLSASTDIVAPAPTDAEAAVIKFSWTNTYYATNPSSIKYIVQIDAVGNNFSKPSSKTLFGKFDTSFKASELNAIAVGLGFAFSVPRDMEARLISSYGNNNEQFISNAVKFSYRPYVIPPKVALPTSGKLFLVGGATDGGWSNPVPTPSQEFARIDETTFMGVFHLSGNGEYLILPVNGDWGNKYSVANNSIPGLNAGGDFDYNLSQNFPGPAATGTYKITVDFQRGKFTVVPYTGAVIPANLFMVGSATPGGWSNPVPTPSQQFVRKNAVQFEIASLAINANSEFLLLPVNGDWGNKYAVANNGLAGLANGGYFGYNFSQNFPGPTVGGNYKFSINFGINDPAAAGTSYFSATKLP